MYILSGVNHRSMRKLVDMGGYDNNQTIWVLNQPILNWLYCFLDVKKTRLVSD